MLGTDYPFLLGELHPGRMIEQSPYTADLKDKLLFKNAMRLLNLDEKFYAQK